MSIRRIFSVLLPVTAIAILFFIITAAVRRPDIVVKEYKDPNFNPVKGTPSEMAVFKEISDVYGGKVSFLSNIDRSTVIVSGKMTKHSTDEPYTHDTMDKRAVYAPIVLFRKFPDVERVRCIISNNGRPYGVDVTREEFEEYVGISADSPANNWGSNVVSMLIYDKVNRDNFMDLYGLYKPEF